MKLRLTVKIGSLSYGAFKFDVGKGSKIKHVVVSGDYFLKSGNEYVKVKAGSVNLSTEPAAGVGVDIRDITSLYGAIAAGVGVNVKTYTAYELWDKEVFSEEDSYWVGIFNGTTVDYVFQVDIIYEKTKKKR